jgi:hypothetical protein
VVSQVQEETSDATMPAEPARVARPVMRGRLPPRHAPPLRSESHSRDNPLVREDATTSVRRLISALSRSKGFVTGMIIADAFWPRRCERRKVRPSGTGASGSTSSVGRPIHRMSRGVTRRRSRTSEFSCCAYVRSNTRSYTVASPASLRGFRPRLAERLRRPRHRTWAQKRRCGNQLCLYHARNRRSEFRCSTPRCHNPTLSAPIERRATNPERDWRWVKDNDPVHKALHGVADHWRIPTL